MVENTCPHFGIASTCSYCMEAAMPVSLNICTGCGLVIENEEPVLSPLGQFHRDCLQRDLKRTEDKAETVAHGTNHESPIVPEPIHVLVMGLALCQMKGPKETWEALRRNFPRRTDGLTDDLTCEACKLVVFTADCTEPFRVTDVAIGLRQRDDDGEVKLHTVKSRACNHKRTIKLRPAQGLVTAVEWCQDCGALHAWDPARFSVEGVKGHLGWILPEPKPTGVGPEHQRLVDAACKLVDAIHPDFCGDLPAALEALAEVMLNDPDPDNIAQEDALRKVSRT